MSSCSRLLFGLTLVTIGSACTHARPQTSVVPGITVHVAFLPGTDTVVYRRTITRSGQDTTAGTRTVVRRVLEQPGGVRLLEVAQRFPGGGGEIVDTALADLRTLRAIAHRSHQPTRTMRFDFIGDSAEGLVSAERIDTVRQGLGGPIFDSNVLDLVIAALGGSCRRRPRRRMVSGCHRDPSHTVSSPICRFRRPIYRRRAGSTPTSSGGSSTPGIRAASRRPECCSGSG